MRVVRFMGASEFNALTSGEVLRNKTDWKKAGMFTTARGFCFFADDEPKEQRIHYASGAGPCATYDYYVVFDAPALLKFRTSWGYYRDIGPGPYDDIIVINSQVYGRRKVLELSLEEYDRQRLPIAEVYAIERDIDAGEWAFRRVM